MKKINIICSHLGFCGVEKVVTSLANSLSKDYDVTIVSMFKLYDSPIFQLNEDVKIKYLINNDIEVRMSNYGKLISKHKFSIVFDNLRRDYVRKGKFLNIFKDVFNGLYVKLYKRNNILANYIKSTDADVIITTSAKDNDILGKCAKDSVLKIGWEHNYHNYNKKYAKGVLKSIENLDYFVLVSRGRKKFYSKRTTTPCVYIPNSIDDSPNEISKLYDLNVCSIGKLTEEKGFFDLIDVFEIVVKKIPQAKLNIIGDGFLMQDLKNKVALKNLKNNVVFHGYQKKEYVNNVLQNSSLYVMTSISESFGIVLLEAFNYGLPCVAFDSASGARELIENEENGYLIKKRDKEAMADKIIELLSNYKLRSKMQKKSLKTVKKYDTKLVTKDWIKLIK